MIPIIERLSYSEDEHPVALGGTQFGPPNRPNEKPKPKPTHPVKKSKDRFVLSIFEWRRLLHPPSSVDLVLSVS